MTISIPNLTKRQVTIAERLWRCQTQADVDRYISLLPAKEQAQAKALVVIMLQQAAEQEPSGDAEMIAADLISRVKR